MIVFTSAKLAQKFIKAGFKQNYLRNYQYDFILKQVSNYNDHLVWDKDDEEAMDFVAACSNIRSKIFGISQKTRFDIKSMAGK